MTSVAPLVGPVATALGVAGALLAVRRGRPWAYGVAKGVASIGFLATALASGAAAEGWTRWVLVALALSAAGDVALERLPLVTFVIHEYLLGENLFLNLYKLSFEPYATLLLGLRVRTWHRTKECEHKKEQDEKSHRHTL